MTMRLGYEEEGCASDDDDEGYDDLVGENVPSNLSRTRASGLGLFLIKSVYAPHEDRRLLNHV